MVPKIKSLIMMFKTFDTFFAKFEHIAKWERATHETPAQLIT